MKLILAIALVLSFSIFSSCNSEKDIESKNAVLKDTVSKVSVRILTNEEKISIADSLVKEIEQGIKSKSIEKDIIKECNEPGDDILINYLKNNQIVKSIAGACGEESSLTWNKYFNGNTLICIEYNSDCFYPEVCGKSKNYKFYLEKDTVYAGKNKSNNEIIDINSKVYLNLKNDIIRLVKESKPDNNATFEEFWAAFQLAVKSGNKKQVADFVLFPLMNENDESTKLDKEDFLKYYPLLVSKNIAKQNSIKNITRSGNDIAYEEWGQGLSENCEYRINVKKIGSSFKVISLYIRKYDFENWHQALQRDL